MNSINIDDISFINVDKDNKIISIYNKFDDKPINLLYRKHLKFIDTIIDADSTIINKIISKEYKVKNNKLIFSYYLHHYGI